MASKRLRVAKESDASPLSLAEAIDAGDYLGILIAQRREIVQALPDTPAHAIAPLHRQVAMLSKEIDTLQVAAVDAPESVIASSADEVWDGTGY